jgi:hypothetical protein
VILFGLNDKPFCATVMMCTLLGVGDGAAAAVDEVVEPEPEFPYCALATTARASTMEALIADIVAVRGSVIRSW